MGLWDAKFSCHNSWKCTMNELNQLRDIRNPFVKGKIYSSFEIQNWCEEYDNDKWIEIRDTEFDNDHCFMFFVSDDGTGEYGGLCFKGID